MEELNAQWYDADYWTRQFHAYEEWDEAIEEFNERTGLLKKYGNYSGSGVHGSRVHG